MGPASTRGALASLALATLLSSLGTSIANVALPTLAAAFDAPFRQVQWIVLAYLLAVTMLIVSAGRMGDLVGRRRLLLGGIALFSAASVACGVAPGLPSLIAARAVQGVGAAIMTSLGLALASESVPPERRGAAMGLLGSSSAVGTAAGPAAGGLVVAGFGWRGIFLVLVPIGLLTLALAFRYLPDAPREAKTRAGAFDRAGMVLLAATLAAYTLAVTAGGRGFGGANLGLLVAAGASCAWFLRVERHAPSPLISLAHLRSEVIGRGLVMSALVSTVVMATLIVGPFYLTESLALDTAIVGLLVAIGPLVAVLTSASAGALVDRLGAAPVTIMGLAGMAAGCSGLAAIPTSAGVAGYVGPMIPLTAGYALFQTANNTAVMAEVDPKHRGSLSGLLNLSRSLGLMTGASLMGAVFAVASSWFAARTAPAAAAASGMRITFALALMGIVAALGVAVRAPSRGAAGLSGTASLHAS